MSPRKVREVEFAFDGCGIGWPFAYFAYFDDTEKGS